MTANWKKLHILDAVIWGSIAMLTTLILLLVPYSVFDKAIVDGVSFVQFSIVPIIFFFLYISTRRGFFIAASYLSIGAYFLSSIFINYGLSVNWQASLFGYVALIAMAALLLNVRARVLDLFLSALFLVFIWYINLHSVISIPKLQYHTARETLTIFCFYAIAVGIVIFSDRATGKLLSQARQEENQLIRERDLLNVALEEWTQALRASEATKIEELQRFVEFGQLSSGLFHDLLNLVNATVLHSEVAMEKLPKKVIIANAHALQKRTERFTQAVRKQLTNASQEERFSIEDSIEQAIQLLEYKAKSAGVNIIFERQNTYKYFGDPAKFHQVMINLITNAIEAHDSFSSGTLSRHRFVKISVLGEYDAIIVRIEDNGCGMTPSVRKKIFEPFFSRKGTKGGIGIGLSTVKKIIEKDFQGSIRVMSGSEGSIFEVRLPI